MKTSEHHRLLSLQPTFPTYSRKKVLIFGLGLNDGGLGMVQFFLSQKAKVTITDLRTEAVLAPTLEKLKKYGDSITYHLGAHREADFKENDIIVRNPAIKPDNPYLKLARDAGKEIVMEMDLFMKLAPCPVIGISGTRGKSTTTMLSYLFLKEHYGKRVVLAGNIGKSAIRELPRLTEKNIVVLEISSFQLDTMRESKRSPPFSLLTNIYQDHLNWHVDNDDYVDCKLTLFSFQTKKDTAIVNLDDRRARKSLPVIATTGARLVTFSSTNKDAQYYRKGTVVYEKSKPLLDLSVMQADGEHNYQNALGAIALARQFDVPADDLKTVLSSFTGVEGRQETIRIIDGITFINDTTATSLEAMVAALKRFGPQYTKKIVMISGGADKGLDYKEILPFWEKYVKELVLLEGTASEKMRTLMLTSSVPVQSFFGNLIDAVNAAYKSAEPGDLVMLCPGAASFNMFTNEFDRGKQFNKIVKGLK